MSRVLWLADVLRKAGLDVVEVNGWRTRGSDTFSPGGVIAHATAGARTSTDQGELNVLLNGSTSAPPPIAQLLLSRAGRYYVVASGRCNHILSKGGVGNTHRIGIEAMNDNRGEPWPPAQYEAYVRGVAAIYRHTGWNLSTLKGHKEHQTEKSDPTFDMASFRGRVKTALTGSPAPSPQPTKGPNMFSVWFKRVNNTVTWAVERPSLRLTDPQMGWEVVDGSVQDELARSYNTVNIELPPAVFDARAALYQPSTQKEGK